MTLQLTKCDNDELLLEADRSDGVAESKYFGQRCPRPRVQSMLESGRVKIFVNYGSRVENSINLSF